MSPGPDLTLLDEESEVAFQAYANANRARVLARLDAYLEAQPLDETRYEEIREAYARALRSAGLVADLRVRCGPMLCRAAASDLTVEEAKAIERVASGDGELHVVGIAGDADNDRVDRIEVYRVQRRDLVSIAGEHLDGVLSPGPAPAEPQQQGRLHVRQDAPDAAEEVPSHATEQEEG